MGRLLPARRERQPSAALPQHGRQPQWSGRYGRTTFCAGRSTRCARTRRIRPARSSAARRYVGDPTFSPNAAGCVPLDIFGNDGASPAAIDYAFRTLKEDNEYKQDVRRRELPQHARRGMGRADRFRDRASSGDPDQADTTHDIANQPWYSSYFLSYGLDRGGDIDVLEGYAEVQIPMSKKLQTDFAVRETQQRGDERDEPDRLRHSRLLELEGVRDLRSDRVAAVPRDALARRPRSRIPRAVPAARVDAVRRVPRQRHQSMDRRKRPVRADHGRESRSRARGGRHDDVRHRAVVRQVPVLGRLVRDRFGWRDHAEPRKPAARGPMFQERRHGAVCDRVTGFGPGGDITAIDSSAVNLAGFLTRGWDYEASYNIPMSAGGNLNLRFIGTYLYDMIVDTGLGAPPIDYEGQSGPVALLRLVQYAAEVAGEGVGDVREESIHEHVRDAVRRVGQPQCDVVRESSGDASNTRRVFGQRQQRRRCLLPGLVGIVRHPPRADQATRCSFSGP